MSPPRANGLALGASAEVDLLETVRTEFEDRHAPTAQTTTEHLHQRFDRVRRLLLPTHELLADLGRQRVDTRLGIGLIVGEIDLDHSLQKVDAGGRIETPMYDGGERQRHTFIKVGDGRGTDALSVSLDVTVYERLAAAALAEVELPGPILEIEVLDGRTHLIVVLEETGLVHEGLGLPGVVTGDDLFLHEVGELLRSHFRRQEESLPFTQTRLEIRNPQGIQQFALKVTGYDQHVESSYLCFAPPIRIKRIPPRLCITVEILLLPEEINTLNLRYLLPMTTKND